MQCLDLLYRQDYRDYHVIVVDDGSIDGTSGRIREKYPQTEILSGDGNLWWTGAMRLGVEHILKNAGRDDFILALNDDVTFREDLVSSLVEASQKYGRAVTGSVYVIEGTDEYRVDGGMVEWAKWNTRYTFPKFARNEGMPEVVSGLDFIFGHGTLIPVEVFAKAGNFNSIALPHYGGDMEFTYRAGREGFGLIASTKALLRVKLDKEHTGVSYVDARYISLKRAWLMLFSIKSAVCLGNTRNLLNLCCPRDYLVTNKAARFTGDVLYCLGMTRLFAIPVRCLSAVFTLLTISVKYAPGAFPVPAGELLRHGVNIRACVQNRLMRKKLFMGREYYAFTVPYETLYALDDQRLAEIYRSSLRPGIKLKWFCEVFR